ncbi:hypothetical protein BASA81_009136 [Batrachochytrium salamandrivorans]|nr:hypothetical protein BASA81_009136 [Batrachochytrium salamandrivorans]
MDPNESDESEDEGDAVAGEAEDAEEEEIDWEAIDVEQVDADNVTHVKALIDQMENAPAHELVWGLSRTAIYHIPFKIRRPFRALAEYFMRMLKRDEYSANLEVQGHCWRLITEWLRMDQNDPDRENLVAKQYLREVAIAQDVPGLVLAEILRQPRREQLLELAIGTLSDIGLSALGADALVRAGLVHPLLLLARELKPNITAIRSLIALTNIALFPNSHASFLANEQEGIQVAISMLGGLTSIRLDELDCALTASFIICRVCGTDEHGPGTEYIHSNSLFLTKLKWVLLNVLRSPHHIFMGAHWDPANILFDVSTLAMSDRNKPLLVGFIPILVSSLKQLQANVRAIRFSIRTLWQLAVDPICLEELVRLVNVSTAFTSVLGDLEMDFSTDLLTLQEISALRRISLGETM